MSFCVRLKYDCLSRLYASYLLNREFFICAGTQSHLYINYQSMYYSALAFAGIASQVALESLQSAQHLTSGEQLWTEWVAWGLLYLLCRIKIQPDNDVESQPPECIRPSFTLLALLFVGVQLVGFNTSDKLRWATVGCRLHRDQKLIILQPLLTVTTFVASILGQSKSTKSFFEDFLQSWRGLLPRSICQISIDTLLIILFLTISIVSSIAFAFQPPTTSASSLLPGSLFLALATGIYALLRQQAEPIPSHTLSRIQYSVFQPLAIQVFAIWTLYLAISAPQSPKLYPWTFIAGILRLVQFYIMVILVRYTLTNKCKLLRFSDHRRDRFGCDCYDYLCYCHCE
jgi:hypothetical protein